MIECTNQRQAYKAKLLEIQTSCPANILVAIKRKKLLDILLAKVDVQASNLWNDDDNEDNSPAEPPGVEEARNTFVPVHNQDNTKNEPVHEVNVDSNST